MTLKEIWKWSDAKLEADHQFIQWLFPLQKRSPHNPSAALTNTETMQTFKADKNLQQNMRTSFDLMLAFYGFEYSWSGNIQKGSAFEDKAKNWLNPHNHNYLRITRILTSLKVHGLTAEAKAFFAVLEEVYKDHQAQIGATTFGIWRSAV